MSGSTTIARITCLAFACLILAACGPNQVVVQGEFPKPLLTKLPVTLGVYYDPEFRDHQFHDKSTSRTEADWIVHSGVAQMQMYDTLLGGMFERVVMLNDVPRTDRVSALDDEAVDIVLVPHVEEFQYAIPQHTKVNVFEVWLRYRYELYDAKGELVADWSMTSYGKTPTAFLQSAEAAVNLAAVVALRDAGANFAMNFARVPEVKQWIESMQSTALDPPEEATP